MVMQGESVRAVLLDMGGVILHMAGGRGFPVARLDWRGRQAMVQEVRTAGGRVTLEELEALVFAPWQAEYGRRVELGREADWQQHLDRLRQQSHCQIDDLDLLAAWFAPYGDQLATLPGASEALANLGKSGLKVALVSNVPLPGELYLRVLRRYGLVESFDHFVFSYDAGSRKPSPAMLRQAMAAIDAEPAETIMVGDRRDRDIVAGRLAGNRTIWIRSDDGGGPEPDSTLDSLAGLPQLLDVWER
jgi:HAD superfamily hydrolase (TIGR01662 family)